jgi:AraC family transcriptional regulator
MQHLQTGQFFEQTNTTIHLDGITLTDTEYTLDKVDWHYHENAYFTFILQGNVIEGNKKGNIQLFSRQFVVPQLARPTL